MMKTAGSRPSYVTCFLFVSLTFLVDFALARRVGEEAHHRKLQPGTPGSVVYGTYIIKFDASQVGGSASEMHQALKGIINNPTKGLRIQHRFHRVFRGFFVNQMDQELLDLVLASDLVESVEEVVETHRVDVTPYWNLDRIDETAYSMQDGTYDYNPNYSGQDVDIYILDDGVYGETGLPNVGNVHPDIAGRYQQCIDYTGEDSPAECLTPSNIGHGVHVACTATGGIYGVSKSARVHDRKIINSAGSGNTGLAASAVEDIMGIYQNEPAGTFKVVINLSIGTAPGGTSYNSLDTMVDAAASVDGIVVVVAAGNDGGQDACTVSPARARKAVTVGGFKWDDVVSPFSNIGSCVDIYAPGNGILSCSKFGGETGKAGTSMASPHVAGAIANYMSADVADPVGRLLSDAVLVTGTSAGDVKFLYTGLIGPDPTEASSANPSVSPSDAPSPSPSQTPSQPPSPTSSSPSESPSKTPTETPSLRPSMQPSGTPSIATSPPTDSPVTSAPSLPPVCLPKNNFCLTSDDCCSNECRSRGPNFRCT